MKHLIVGCGQHGISFVRKLTEFDEKVVVVDSNADRIAEVRGKFGDKVMDWHVAIPTDVASQGFDAGWVLTNTASHHRVAAECRNAGIDNLFIEKPVCAPRHLAEMREVLKGATGACGYLLRFSEAALDLKKFMDENELLAHSITTYYGKPRVFVPDTHNLGTARPTEGDFVDETTHCIDLQSWFVRNMGQPLTIREVCCQHSRLPYVNSDAQAKLRESDPTIPFDPDSSTVWHLRYEGVDAVLQGVSSYVMPVQTRLFDFTLGRDRQLTHYAKLEFDKLGQDWLTIWDVRRNAKTNEPIPQGFACDKLGDQIKATLRLWSTGKTDVALATLEDGLEQAAILEDMKARSRQG